MKLNGFFLRYPLGHTYIKTDTDTSQEVSDKIAKAVSDVKQWVEDNYSQGQDIEQLLKDLDAKNLDTNHLELFTDEGKQELISKLNESGFEVNNLEDIYNNLDNEDLVNELKNNDVDPKFIKFLFNYEQNMKLKADLRDDTDDGVYNPLVVPEQLPNTNQHWEDENNNN